MTDHSLTSFNPTKHSDSKTHKATGMQKFARSFLSAMHSPLVYRHPPAYAEWQGKKSIQVNDHPLPLLTDPVGSCARSRDTQHHIHFRNTLEILQSDVMLRVTSTAICGSDLHLYLNAMPGQATHLQRHLSPTSAKFVNWAAALS